MTQSQTVTANGLSAHHGHVLVRDGEREITRVPLAGGRLVVGRSPEVEVQLPNDTVSRAHAEFFVDPFGRWWIRDLGSRNGTLVNGEAIDEHLLEPGDTIQIDAFSLAMELATPAEHRTAHLTSTAASIGLTITDGDEHVSRLEELPAPRVDASHLSMLTSFSGELLATKDGARRLEAVCRLMVGQTFRGNTAMALRLDKTGPLDQDPQLLCAPVQSGNSHAGEKPYISGAMLRAVRDAEAPVLASNVSTDAQNVVEISASPDVMRLSAVMCPIHIRRRRARRAVRRFPR